MTVSQSYRNWRKQQNASQENTTNADIQTTFIKEAQEQKLFVNRAEATG
jgi:hypothetical protein